MRQPRPTKPSEIERVFPGVLARSCRPCYNDDFLRQEQNMGTEACKAAQANGIGLEELMDFSRHSRKSIAILMVYRDRERNGQGQLASLLSANI